MLLSQDVSTTQQQTRRKAFRVSPPCDRSHLVRGALREDGGAEVYLTVQTAALVKVQFICIMNKLHCNLSGGKKCFAPDLAAG